MTRQSSFVPVEKMQQYFSDALGPEGVIPGSSGRAYVQVGTKGEGENMVRLYASVSLVDTYYQKPEGGGHAQAAGVLVRFRQRGGNGSEFTPPLSVRNKEGDSFLLSRYEFPVCSMGPVQEFLESWKRQEVNVKLAEWIKGVITFTEGTPIADGLIQQLVESALPNPADIKGVEDVFSLEVKADEVKIPSNIPMVAADEGTTDDEPGEDSGDYDYDDDQEDEENLEDADN